MKSCSLFILALALIASPAHAKSIFDKIVPEAQTGNGVTKIGSYDTGLKKNEVNELGKKELEKEYWENCGPWKVITSRREAIQKIEKLESMQEKTKVVDKLNALYDQDKIVTVVAAISNNEVECSLSWFNFYGADGSVMKMRYNMGD